MPENKKAAEKCNGCSAIIFTENDESVYGSAFGYNQYKCREIPVKARGGDFHILAVRRTRNRPDLTYIKKPGRCPRR